MSLGVLYDRITSGTPEVKQLKKYNIFIEDKLKQL